MFISRTEKDELLARIASLETSRKLMLDRHLNDMPRAFLPLDFGPTLDQRVARLEERLDYTDAEYDAIRSADV